MTTKPNSGTRDLLERVLRHLEWFGSTASKEVNELRAMLAEQRIVCSNGILCQSTECAECGGNGSYKSGTKVAQPADQQGEEKYPPCDYCGMVPDYHPWHGSGMLRGVESRHIHACHACRAKLPAHVDQQGEPVAWINNETLDRARNKFGSYYLSPKHSDEDNTPLYAQPATAKLESKLAKLLRELKAKKWNTTAEWQCEVDACLDEVAKLNGENL